MTDTQHPAPQDQRGTTSTAHGRRPQQHQHGEPARPRRRAPRAHRAGLRRRHPRPRQPDHPLRRARRGRPRRAAPRRAGRRSSAPARASPARPSSGSLAHAARRDHRAPGRRAEPQHPVQPRPLDPAQDAEPEALRRLDRQAHDHLRHRPRRHRQDLPRDGQGGPGAAVQAGQPDHPDPPGGRGGRAARLPARHAEREDRPLPAAALRRAARHDRPRVDPASCWPPAPSRSPRWRTCAAGRNRSTPRCSRRTACAPIGELAVGDLVVGSDGLPTPVLGVYPAGSQGGLPGQRPRTAHRPWPAASTCGPSAPADDRRRGRPGGCSRRRR